MRGLVKGGEGGDVETSWGYDNRLLDKVVQRLHERLDNQVILVWEIVPPGSEKGDWLATGTSHSWSNSTGTP